MSKKGHIPIRMCVGCRNRREKGEMVRFTRIVGGMDLIDEKKNLRGRGFYLCPDLKCLKIAQKKMNKENRWERWIPYFQREGSSTDERVGVKEDRE